MSQNDADNLGWRGVIAARLCGNTGWTSSSTANAAGNTSATGRNSSGFSALPAGGYYGDYSGFGNSTGFWSTTDDTDNSYTHYVHGLGYNYAGVHRGNSSTYYGHSVRCVRDEGVSMPNVTTTAVTNITLTTAICGGIVNSDGGATVTTRGVCWSTTHNPTTSDSHTTDGSGTGNFTSSITGLTAGTAYYVRAYATNSVGTAYGNEVSFTTIAGSFTCGTSTLTDIDGNTYNTVLIGTQCWMKENLRTTKYADNIPISQGSETSNMTAYWYYPNDDTSNKATYGLLYNWKAVMRDAVSSSANPSGVQGICPTGWHVPSDAEWTQLTDYVSSQSQYVCSSTSTQIAKALASTTSWNSSNTTCAVGNTPSNNNATGFSALPAGYYYGDYIYIGNETLFWSATECNSAQTHGRYLYNHNAGVLRDSALKTSAFSVRCIKD